MSGDQELATYAASLRAAGAGAVEEVARAAAPGVEAAIKATAAAGTDPGGGTWPTRKDGSRALPNAAESVATEAAGGVIITRLTGGEVYHHRSKGKRPRRILPDSGAGIPVRVADAIKEAASRVLSRLTG